MKVINPYNNKVAGEIDLMSKEQINFIVDKAVNAEKAMKKLTGKQRRSILFDIAERIEDRKEAFISTIIVESGKPRKYAIAEVSRAIETFSIAAEESIRWPHELMDLDRSDKGKTLKAKVFYEPVGLTFGISPFNFPLNLAVHKIAPAIAAGCPILLKPSSKTPLTMELLKDIILETELPDGAFEIIHCSRENGNDIIKSDKIKLISFTGSPNVGWKIKEMSGKKRVVLELGGNAATIICDDVEVNEKLIDEMVVGGFAYSGQVCIHTQRIYVHKSKFDEFLKKYKSAVEKLQVGDPISSDTNYSCMIDESNIERVHKWVEEAKNNGAKIITGGKRVEDNSYAPTVLTEVKKGDKVRDEEVFGPVVVVEPFTTLDDAISMVNDSRWGLQASIYTDKISYLNKAFENLSVGGVIHNLPTTFRVDEMPYGGIKDSGFGREGVKYAIKDYFEPKLLVSE